MLLLGGTKKQQQIFGRVNLCTYWANRWSSQRESFLPKRWHLKFSGLLDDIASSSYHYFPKKKQKKKTRQNYCILALPCFYVVPVAFWTWMSLARVLPWSWTCKSTFSSCLTWIWPVKVLPKKSSFVFCPAKIPGEMVQNLSLPSAKLGPVASPGWKNRLWHWHRWKHYMKATILKEGAVGQLATATMIYAPGD